MTPKHLRSDCGGFTLMELAVVLVIVALLIGGMLVPLSSQNDLRYRQDTDKSLAQIREALLGFSVANGRLPCPAPPTLADGSTGAGLEATTAVAGTTSTVGPCGCTSATSGIASAGGTACDDTTPGGVMGVLPWATLGLPETDTWGNRFTYRVTTRFARAASSQTIFGGSCTPSANPTSAAFALCSPGDITVLSAASAGVTVASAVPAVILSHGKNGLGAYTQQGTQTATAAAGTDEYENSNGDATFVSNTAIDDQLIWVSPSVLMNRMVAAGKLP